MPSTNSRLSVWFAGQAQVLLWVGSTRRSLTCPEDFNRGGGEREWQLEWNGTNCQSSREQEWQDSRGGDTCGLGASSAPQPKVVVEGSFKLCGSFTYCSPAYCFQMGVTGPTSTIQATKCSGIEPRQEYHLFE